MPLHDETLAVTRVRLYCTYNKTLLSTIRFITLPQLGLQGIAVNVSVCSVCSLRVTYVRGLVVL